MNAVIQRQRQRFLFLKYLYDTTGGSTSASVKEEEIAKALGFTNEEVTVHAPGGDFGRIDLDTRADFREI